MIVLLFHDWRYGWRDAFTPAAAIGGAAAAILPALFVVRRVAALTNDDLVGEAFAAHAAAGVLHELRLLAGDEFDTGGGGQIELITQIAGPFDKSLQISTPR